MRGKSCVEDGETSWRVGTAGENCVLKWALLGDGEVVGAVVIQCDGFAGHEWAQAIMGAPLFSTWKASARPSTA